MYCYKKQFLSFLCIICISVILFCGIMSDNDNNNSNNISQNKIIKSENNIMLSTDNKIEEQEIEENLEQKQENIIEEYLYTISSVNIRKLPNINSEIVATAPINTSIIKIGEVEGWAKIKREDNIYYIKNTLLAKDKQQIIVASRNAEVRSNNNNNNNNNNGLKYLGNFKLTAYCGCAKCCGKSNGITASGVKAIAGVTIAAPSNFAFGTKLSINGHIYTVQDRGGAIKGNKIDIYFNSHSEAIAFGTKNNIPVYKVD